MRIAILSDTRFPTNLNFPGHGLGRAVARLGMGLAQLGHEVIVCAAPKSYVAGCSFIEFGSEDYLEFLASGPQWCDVYIDSTHQHRFAWLRQDLPVLSKRCDREGTAPNRRVYGNWSLLDWCNDGGGKVINEGIDVDSIPFNSGKRMSHLLYPSTAAWKRADLASEIATRAGFPLWLLGDNETVPATRVLPNLSGWLFYGQLEMARAVLSTVGTMATLEAAATGTPSIGIHPNDSWIEHGVSGWLASDVAEAAEYCHRVDCIDPAKARQWVADCRSLKVMAQQWEEACLRAMDGEVW